MKCRVRTGMFSKGVARGCGDGPVTDGAKPSGNPCSPQVRGWTVSCAQGWRQCGCSPRVRRWTGASPDVCPTRGVLPVGEGMDRHAPVGSTDHDGVLRRCGAGLSSPPASRSILQRFAHKIAGLMLGGATGARIGTALLRRAGGYLGGMAGATMGKALQAAYETSIETTDRLVNQVLLNPVLMRVLLSKATPQNQVTLLNGRGQSTPARVAAIGGAIGDRPGSAETAASGGSGSSVRGAA